MASSRFAAWAALSLASVLAAAASDVLSPAEQRGKQIFEQGTSAAGRPVSARLQSAAEWTPASLTPCAGCHGADGLGKSEGGIDPSDITWDTLTKPYRVASASGRERPPYDAKLLKRAITLGIDSAGNRLDPAMPRFQMTLTDADDLVAYIRRLGDAAVPGLTDTEIRIGVSLPDEDRAVWNEFFDRLNRDGGVYGRRIVSIFADRGAEQVFALGLSGRVPADPAVPAVVISAAPGDPRENPAAFYLDSGPEGEVAALCEWFLGQPRANARGTAVVVDRSALSQRLAKLVFEKLAAAGLPAPSVLSAADAVNQYAAVFWLSGEARPYPNREILLPGVFAPQASVVPAAAPDFHFVIASSGVAPFPPARAGARTAVAAVLMAEAFQRAGRQLSRSAFIAAMEDIHDFESGVLAPLSFSANHHCGIEKPSLFTARPGAGHWEFERLVR